MEASTFSLREIAAWLSVQIFGSVASSRSQLDDDHAKSLPATPVCGETAHRHRRKHLLLAMNLLCASSATRLAELRRGNSTDRRRLVR
ncbi:hypothetical protein AS156_25985 [Bradyrhizobium macuxiense]|uniref:Uncharacterized protein n=2 Tax=Bradyrhizobium macuxiense TaxID=1755647 RepID=A0A109K548_9BRAD|nr:hypothetical protein AS156_25985 [Bradyrhizobium macuxiense]